MSPLPPAATGIADYAADVLAVLAPAHEIDVFHGQDDVDASRLPASCALYPASQLLARQRREPYEAVVYQMGNGLSHAFLYPLLPRAPGLLVLHDLVLHHSRARMLLDTPAARAYAREPWSLARRAAAAAAFEAYAGEVAHGYPAQAARLVPAQLGTVGDLLPYAYPLFRLPVEASRVVAVHNRFMADAVKADVPSAEVVRVAMPVEPLPVTHGAGAAVRARHGIGAGDLVVGCFGLLTREKEVAVVARAVARAAFHLPGVRLLLVGPAPDGDALARTLERAGVGPRATVAGHVPFAELGAHLEASDVVAHLRYPTARETSAALLRALAQGRATVMSDLENLAEVPEAAVLRADPTDEEGGVLRAILRLAAAPAARAALGARARAFVAGEHSLLRCRESYTAALERTAARHAPAPGGWPRHWRAEGETA
ncbi:MAG TPA: glycosyltransferase [Vicinamibacteria bacterium]|nr:glycosyltransferase [Vicinamibacteria bacterium]